MGKGIRDIKQYDSLVSMLHDRETLLIRKVKQVCRHLGRISLPCLSVLFVPAFVKIRIFCDSFTAKHQLYGTAFIHFARY